MADPIVVIVFLASVGAPDPVGGSLRVATQQAIGHDAVVLVEASPELPSEDAAQSIAERRRAAAAIELEWHDAAHTRATVRVHTEGIPGWAAREMAFRPEDPPDERGRTIGFAAASLIEARPPYRGDEHATPPAAGAPLPRWMVDVAGLVAMGAGSDAASAGGEVAGTALLQPRFGLAVMVAARFGEIASAQSTLSNVQFGGGAVWRALVYPTSRPFEVDLRADFLSSFVVAARQAQTQSSWLPVGRLAVEAAWFPFIDSLGFIALAGGEAALGSVSVDVGDRNVGTVSPFRAIGELGLRTRF